MIIRKSQAEIEGMARAGELVSDTLAMIGEELRPGISMVELDRLAESYIRERGGVPTSKGYRGYPATLCISPNAMIVHGIPTDYRAAEGDVVSVDLGITLDGLIADSAYTFGVGEITPDAQQLLEVCQEALVAGIDQARVGNHVSDIGHAIQQVVESAGFSVVRSLVGHGVGRAYHEDPQVPNFGEPGHGPELLSGMTLAIEPMINAGGPEVVMHADEWSISSADGSLSAHFEHTVAVTEDAGFSIVRTLVGHGVGRSYHEDPQVPNFVSSYRGPELREGMTIAIEPMITAGAPDIYVHDDDWSISTVDGSLAAHFEHTVAITKDGPRILTPWHEDE